MPVRTFGADSLVSLDRTLSMWSSFILSSVTIVDGFRAAAVVFFVLLLFTLGIRTGRVGIVVDLNLVAVATGLPLVSAANVPLLDATL